MSDKIVTGIFNDSYAPITDGVAMVTKNYAYWLNRLVGPSCVITPDMPNYYDTEEFPVYRYLSLPIASRPPYRVGMNFAGEVTEKRRRGEGINERLHTNLMEMPFSLVHAHCPFTSGMLAQNLAHIKKIPLVTTFHTKYRKDFEHSLKGNKILVDVAMMYLKRFYESADYVWVPSADTIETMREYGIKGRIEVMPNGTDLNVSDEELSLLRDEGAKIFTPDSSAPLLLYLGQHIKEKNLDLLIEALAIAKRDGPDFRMVFIGDGYHRKDMEARVAELGLSDRVSFKGIIRDREVIKKAYARADILVFPSLYDTSSLIVKESAGMRLPSLLVQGSTTSEGVEDGHNGFLAENSAEAYAKRLVAALEDGASRRKAGLGAYRTLYRSWENVIEEVGERYRAIVKDWKGR
jgi:glycosyltransferase involved in cell wall biosynthesis